MQQSNEHNFETLIPKQASSRKNKWKNKQQQNGLWWHDHIFLSNYETMSDKQFEEVNLQGSITDQFED